MSLDGTQLHVVDSLDTAMEMKRWLSTITDKINIDTEGTGYNAWKDRMRMVQFGRNKVSYAIPIEGPGSWAAFAVELLQAWRGDIVMFNAPYDHAMIKKTLKVDLPKHKIRDPRLMAHVMDSQGSLALKNLAQKHVDPRAKVGQEALDEALGSKGGWTWETIPLDYKPYWAYAGLDTILTDEVDDYFYKRVMADAPVSYELEMAVAWVCAEMTMRGVRIDRPYVNSFIDRSDAYVLECEKWCEENYHLRPSSNDRVADALVDAGIELTKLTPGGKYSVDKEVLSAIDHPLARTVLRRRQVQRMQSFAESYLEFADADDMVHPAINSVGGSAKNEFEPGGEQGVRTGRMSMDKPNLQQVPTRTTAGKRIRQMFVPSPGNVWVKADFDQIEMRILADLSGDPEMKRAFLSEGDFFVNMAITLFNEPDFKKADPRRQFVKNSGYAKAYGAGLEQFARTAGATIEQAAKFMAQFDRTYPHVQRYVNGVQRDGRLRYETEGDAWIRSTLTNRKHVADHWRIYTLTNYLIQGLGGEIIKQKIVEADQAGLTKYMTLPVHDEVDADVPEAELDDYVRELGRIMNDDRLLSIPITTTIETGPNWGECVAA